MTPCKECAYCSPTPGGSLYCALTDHFVPNLGCEHGEPINKPKTNADRIRAMTDDELTRFFAENCGCGDWCMHHRSGACANKPENECCLDVWHKWLKSSADEVSE